MPHIVCAKPYINLISTCAVRAQATCNILARVGLNCYIWKILKRLHAAVKTILGEGPTEWKSESVTYGQTNIGQEVGARDAHASKNH